MQFLSMIGSLVRRHFTAAALQGWCLILLVMLIGQTTLVVLMYRAAAEHVLRNDPRRLQNRSEVSFMFLPLELKVGSKISVPELSDYLNELGYQQRPESLPASYYIMGNSLSVVPRNQTIGPISITVERDRITDLLIDGRSVTVGELEALPMQDFVRYLSDDSLRQQRVRRTVISPGEVPAMLGDAVINIEDRRFMQHHGIDVFGIVNRVRSGDGGGSSITQQLIKNTIFKGAKNAFWQRYLWFLPATLQRKATDVFVALATERMMTKAEILAAYLSIIPLGAVDGVELHGVSVAAREYFGKSLSELTLPECATLAAMINRPSDFVSEARRGDYRSLTARRDTVLSLMKQNNPSKYSNDEIESARAVPLRFVFAGTQSSAHSSSFYSRQFAELAARNLSPALAQMQTSEGSLQVITTLDFRLQKAAIEIAEEVAGDLRSKVSRICHTRSRQASDVCDSAIPQVSLVAMDPKSGGVLTMVGGVNSSFNYATAKRSPGSAIKPLVYLGANRTWAV